VSVATYTYDFSGRRVSKTTGGVATAYAYDGDQVIAEYQGDTLVRKFIYGSGIDEPICMIISEGIYYYHFDGLGSVIALSDEAGDIAERYSYDVYGEPNRTSDIGNPYLFTGRGYDVETGNYYYRARYYRPQIGRFLQADPIGYTCGLNLYSYCGNTPIICSDPYGLLTLKFGAGWGLGGSVTIEYNGGNFYISINGGIAGGGFVSIDSIDSGKPVTGERNWGIHVIAQGAGGHLGSIGVSGETGVGLTLGNERDSIDVFGTGSLGPAVIRARGHITQERGTGNWGSAGSVNVGGKVGKGAGLFGLVGGGVHFYYGQGNSIYDALYNFGFWSGEVTNTMYNKLYQFGANMNKDKNVCKN
jgi:RHS repeat-associated protein